MLKSSQKSFMQRAIELAQYGMDNNFGGPFGAVIVKDGHIIGEGYNSVTSKHDPTAHAEIIAIRTACEHLNAFQLSDCEIYCSCEPCAMCLGAIYWSRINTIYFAANQKNAAYGGFDDAYIFKEYSLHPANRKIKTIELMSDQGLQLFEDWLKKSDKTPY